MLWRRLNAAFTLAAIGGLFVVSASLAADGKVTRYARFQVGDTVAYGIVEEDHVRQIDGDLFDKWQPTERRYPLSSVKLLVPSARPTQVLALAGNYKSHLGGGDHVTTVTTTTKVTTNVNSGQTCRSPWPATIARRSSASRGRSRRCRT